MKRVPLFPILSIFLCFTWFACERVRPDIDPEEVGISDVPDVIVFFPPNGPGDNGYLDKVLSAVSRFSIEHPGKVRIVRTTEEYTDTLSADLLIPVVEWMIMSDTHKDTTLAVFVGSEFKDILYRSEAPEGRAKILLMEDDGIGAPEWLHTCKIERYGACYLSGAMVAQLRAVIIAAMPDDPVLERSIEGFKKGYGSIKGREVDSVYYLANDYKGFTMQKKARTIVDSLQKGNDMWDYCTVFPLAGAANIGVYNGLHEATCVQAVGMDKDYSPVSDNIPFSINIGIDSLIIDYLNKWHDARILPKRKVEGLGSKYIDIIFNEQWNSLNLFYDWEDENHEFDIGFIENELKSEFWKMRYAMFIDKAMEEEKAYAEY